MIDYPNKFLNYYLPTRTLFGANALQQLHTLPMPGKKAMICTTGEAFYKDLGYTTALENELTQCGVEFVYYEGVIPNPPVECVMKGGEAAKENGVDFLVSLGGGGCHDCAKAIAVAATNEGNVWDYVGGGTGGGKPIVNTPLPLVTINMTAGTGSHINCGSVINNLETDEKLSIVHPSLFPVICVDDSALMTSVPPLLTAAQGFDAFDHCMEAFISVKTSMFSDMYALAGIEHAAKYLGKCVKDGKDIDARDHLAYASHMGGRTLVTCGAAGLHGLEHAMSAYFPKLPHGIGLALVAREYFKVFVDRGDCEDRFIKAAKVMGNESANKASDFIDALDAFLEDIGMANLKMSDYGITPDSFAKLEKKAKDTMARLFLNDPSYLETEDVIGILERSYK